MNFTSHYLTRDDKDPHNFTRSLKTNFISDFAFIVDIMEQSLTLSLNLLIKIKFYEKLKIPFKS